MLPGTCCQGSSALWMCEEKASYFKGFGGFFLWAGVQVPRARQRAEVNGKLSSGTDVCPGGLCSSQTSLCVPGQEITCRDPQTPGEPSPGGKWWFAVRAGNLLPWFPFPTPVCCSPGREGIYRAAQASPESHFQSCPSPARPLIIVLPLKGLREAGAVIIYGLKNALLPPAAPSDVGQQMKGL